MTSKSTYREACATEFRWENFWFPVRNRKRFVKPQWSYIPTLLWRVWKVVIATYFIAWLGVSLERFRVDSPKAPQSKWLIFLTHWTYLFFTGYLLISAINVCLNSFCHRRHRTVTLGLWSLKLQWFLWNVGAPATVAVVLLYWSILWPNRPAPRHRHPSIMNVHVHLVNGIIILVDQAFHAMPMNYYHVYQPMLYGVAYATFTGVYYEANGTDPSGKRAIYPFLNYATNRKMALGADFGVIFIAIPVIWTFLYGLHCLRNFIWRTCDPFASESFSLDDAHGKVRRNTVELEVYTVEKHNANGVGAR